MSEFAKLGLSTPLVDCVKNKGYDSPTPIQAKVIPPILESKDVMAASQTGTGKTAAFTLPILDRLRLGTKAKPNHVRALILSPTRELSAQIAQSVTDYGAHLDLSSAVVFGGVNINPQKRQLQKGVDILIATPGRLLDLYNQGCVKFTQLQILVLDEADRMLDMGFIHDIKKIMALLPKNRQTLLFSATFSGSIRELAKGVLKKPLEVSVTPPNSTVSAIEQSLYAVQKKEKPQWLASLIESGNWYQTLVFCRTKYGADKLTRFLIKQKISAVAIHGNKTQNARTRALKQFKDGDVQVLVATDIAARGLDIHQLPYVVNYELPNVPEDYVHRIGRTGRAGATGQAISLVSIDEFDYLVSIERLIKQVLTRKSVDTSIVSHHHLPKSSLDSTPKKGKGGKRSFRPKEATSNKRKNPHYKRRKKRPDNNS